jgi:hypothetical protein
MAKIKIGAPYTFTPDAFVGELATNGERIRHQIEGRIVYIHPQHRFFTAPGASKQPYDPGIVFDNQQRRNRVGGNRCY